MEQQTTGDVDSIRSPFSFHSVKGRKFAVGDALRVRGVPMTVRYLDGHGGMVFQAEEDVNPRRFKVGSIVSVRGRRLRVLLVRGVFLSVRG